MLSDISEERTASIFTVEDQEVLPAVTSSSSYMALQPILGLGLLFMRFRNLTLIDDW
jgi:hypothetical protein